MKGKQIISLLAAASMTMGCLTGCGAGQETVTGGSTEQGSTAQGSQGAGSSTEKVVLRLSMNMTLGSKGIVEEVMNDVLKDYPNVELQVEETAQDSYVSKMAMDVSTDNVADLVQYWRPDSTTHGCPKYIEKGAFADLSELLGMEAFRDRFADHACILQRHVPHWRRFVPFQSYGHTILRISLPVPYVLLPDSG